MGEPYKFEHKFFQRGQTWPELLSSWANDRQTFLEQVASAPLLARLADQLGLCPPGSRIVVWFDQWRADVRKALPAIGKTLSRASALEVRFFDSQIFFPELYTIFGRPLPQLALLDQEMTVSQTWGPRPNAIQMELEKLTNSSSHAKSLFLQDYNDDAFHVALDQELTEKVCAWLLELPTPA